MKNIRFLITLLLPCILIFCSCEYKNTEIQKPDEFIAVEEYTLPDHVRPDGYDDIVLTKEVALDILHEAREMQIRLFDGGLFSGLDSYNDISGLDSMYITERVYYDFEKDDFDPWTEFILYYIPELDTYEEFTSYFRQVLTDYTVSEAIIDYDIAEFDGRLGIAGLKYSGAIYEREWTHAYVSEVIQEEDSDTAIVKAITYDSGKYPMEIEYKFEFSEKFGWRVEIEDIQRDM